MAEFLTTKGIAYHIDEILKRAEKTVWILSPYLDISKLFSDRLREVDKRGVSTVIIYREENKLTPDLKQLFEQLSHSRTLCCKELHAKCYRNEQDIVVTSMNMLEYSEQNNREMGILINKKTDEAMFADAVKEIDSIVGISIPDSTSKLRKVAEAQQRFTATSQTPQLPRFCPKCGSPLVPRKAKKGENAGKVFLGCSRFPHCHYTYP